MKTIGIKLADGTFYPILEEGTPKKRMLDLTTAKDNQTKVQIDLYRSENGSMEEAEYVDTLEVTKLVPHPNGEPEFHLSIGLDDKNNLTAEVVDPETGKKSETEVNLVSRTLAERAEPADFALNDSRISPASEVTEDFSFEDFSDETLAADDSVKIDDIPDFSDSIIDDDPTNPDPAISETTLSPEDLPEIKSDALEDMPFSFDTSEAFTTDDVAETSTDDDDLGISDTTLESVTFESSIPDATQTDDFSSESVPDDYSSDAILSGNDDTFASDSTDLDLPDFDETVTEETAAGDDSVTGLSFDDLNDPSFAATESDIDNAFDTSALDAPADESGAFASDTFNDDFTADFDTSDLDETLDKLNSKPEGASSGYSTGSAMDFSDLYDKETINGEHASIYDNDEEEKKVRIPVIICIICAIICVLATILILFIVPSKYNLIKSRNTKASSEVVTVEKSEVAALPEPVEEKKEPVKEVKEEPAPAVEDKIVIVEEPAKVVPAPAPKPEKKPDVKYHIRWGDTLWDISESYYKTPWKYKKIAKHNRIKNPDYIISGTDIIIPAE